jgi:hypothetical protein
MNREQVASLVRQAMLFVGGVLAGVSFIAKIFTPDQVISLLTSDTVITTLTGLVMAGFASIWALITRSDKNLVASANNVENVAGVITKDTLEGRALATSIPSPTVVSANTSAATSIAKS